MRMPTYDNVMIEMIIYAQIKVVNMKIMINLEFWASNLRQTKADMGVDQNFFYAANRRFGEFSV